MDIFKRVILAFLIGSGPAAGDALSQVSANLPQAPSIIDLSRDNFDGQHLGMKTFWYKGEESINQLEPKTFTRGLAAVINQGYTSDNYWYRIDFLNPFGRTEKIYLHDPHNVYDEFEVYLGTNRVGSLRQKDALKRRIVTIELPADSTSSIYIRKKTNAVVQQTTFTFWKDYEALRDSIHSSEVRYQTVITMLVMSIFLTTSLLFAYRKVIYLYYLGYLLSFVMFSSWVWSVHYIPFFVQWGGVLSVFCVVFTALFVNEFLDMKQNAPRLHKVFHVFSVLSLAATGLELVDPIMRAYAGTILSTIIQATTVWFGTSLFFKTRQIHVLIFNVAFGSFLISGFIQMLIWMGLIDSAENHLMFYGVAAENFLMLLAMGYRILVSELARKQSDNLLVHSYEQLSKVFYPHQILQIRDGRMVEETMPVGEKDACILYFHIVGGAALMHEGYEDCVEDFMIRCRQLLMEQYDPLNFCCNAYMIREMGDGFLCSVGYPFHQIGRLKSESAVDLAEKLIQEFDCLVTSLDAPHKIHCSIGIVRGLVKSYFSKSGRIRDDLWGRSITLASTYGEASSQLFTTLGKEPRNIIVLHDAVFESLPHNKRKDYEVMDFHKAQGIFGQVSEAEFLAFRVYGEDDYASSIHKVS